MDSYPNPTVLQAQGGDIIFNTTSIDFIATVVNPSLFQASTSAATTSSSLTIQAQNNTHATSTGGNLVLASGTGTNIDGYVQLQVGGVTITQVDGYKLWAQKGWRQNVTSIAFGASPYTILSTDNIIAVDGYLGAISITLPGSPNIGDTYQCKDVKGTAATNNITLDSGSGNNIDAAQTLIINTNYASITIVCTRHISKPMGNNMNLCLIYKISNKVNDKIYIGQTWRTIKKRWKNGYGYIRCPHIGNAINKHGKDNFIITLLVVCSTQETADYWEDYFIEKYDSRNRKYGYNIREGGSYGKLSLETKLKISLSKKGKLASEETKNKLSLARKGENNPNYGKHMSKETRKKISASNKGQHAGEDNPFYGKTHTEEARKKISQALTGTKQTKEAIINRFASRKGYSPSVETIEKIRLGNIDSHKGQTWKLIDGKRVWLNKYQ